MQNSGLCGSIRIAAPALGEVARLVLAAPDVGDTPRLEHGVSLLAQPVEIGLCAVEPLLDGALDDLRSILAESAPDIRIAGTTESVMQSVAWLEKNPAPDLIFMDIHLSDGSAFEIFKRTAVEAPVIFTTAYDEYAIHAFRVNAVDYLLKPLAIDEVKRALEKYRKLSRPQVLPDIEKLYEMISCQRTNSRRNILVAYKDKLLPIPTEKIAFFYSTKETSRVYLADGSNYAYNRTLESICDDMDPRAFCRVNKQYVVAREHITSIVVWSNSRLLVSMEPRRPSPYS